MNSLLCHLRHCFQPSYRRRFERACLVADIQTLRHEIFLLRTAVWEMRMKLEEERRIEMVGSWVQKSICENLEKMGTSDYEIKDEHWSYTQETIPISNSWTG